LYYLKSRYYDPEICRFINADDASMLGANGDVVSYNLFAYCGDNPVNRVDLAGFEPITASILATLALCGSVCILLSAAAAYISTPVGQRSFRRFVSSVVEAYNTLKVTVINVASAAKTLISHAEKNLEKTYSVYFWEDEGGTIQYVGRVSDLGYAKRMSYHKKQKDISPNIEFRDYYILKQGD